MAHLVKHLVHKHEIYCVHVKSPIMIAHAWNPSSREVEMGGSLGLTDQPGSASQVSSRPERCPVSKAQRQGWSSGDTAQWLRVHTALIEDPSLVPSTHVRCLKMSCSSSSRALIPFSVLWLVDTDSHANIPIETHTIKKIKINLRKIKEVDRSRGMIPTAELCFYTKVHESMHSYTL